MKFLSFYKPQVETLARNELKALQLKRLRAQLNYVYENSELHNKKYKDAKINPSDIKELDDLKKIPLITRQELQEWVTKTNDTFGGRLCVPEEKLVQIFGPPELFITGEPVIIGLTPNDHKTMSEQLARHYKMLGLKEQDVIQIASQAWEYLATSLSYPFSMFVGQSADRILDFHVLHQLDLGPEGSRTYNTAKYFKPNKALFTTNHADSIGLLSLSEEWSVGDIGYEHIIFRGYTNAVNAEQKKKYQEDWKAKINNMLDIQDNLFFAADCEEYNGLHVWEDMFVVEAVNPETGELVGSGENGKLVISNLFAEAVPVIRYLTNVDVMLDEDKCPCGRTHIRIFTPNYK